jgi:type IV pilus assembly protein PilA
MKKLNRSTKGFTLVEIMIVVVIIGLLAAMAVPAFQKVRKNSIGKAMANDARQIASACQQIMLTYPGNTTLTINYAIGTGAVTNAAVAAGATNAAIPVDEITKYVQKISRGYSQGNIVYNTIPAANGTSFQMSQAQVAPIDVAPGSTTANVSAIDGDPVSFDTEGKPVYP